MRALIIRLIPNRDLHAFLFLTVFVGALYLPGLGDYAFWDPWEPHYSQVAFEMAEHGTWMDPWYRGQNHWWSKPILPLWLLRASFGMMGVDSPDHPHLHLAGRLPFFLLALMGILLTYRWVSRLYGRRSGFYSALVLGTSPMYALLGHQIMFDMPFVAFCASAIGYFILSRSDSSRPGDLVVSFILIGFAFLSKWLLAIFIPAGITLAVLVMRWDKDFFRRVGWKHWLGTGLFLAAAATFFELSVHDLVFSAMLSVCMLAVMLLYWMSRDTVVLKGWPWYVHWMSFAAFLAIVIPWHAFMIAKHGWPFLREAVIYHHFERAAGTIGKPEGAFDVYVKQLAFGLFPWIALLPAALVRMLRGAGQELLGKNRRDIWLFLAAAVPYAAFSLFQTKFHHYIFPVLPFLAVIIGVFLARMHEMDDRPWMRVTVMLSLPVGAMLVADLTHEYKWFMQLFDYYYSWPLPADLNPYPFFAIAGGLWLMLLASLFFLRRINTAHFAGLALVASAVTVFLTAHILPGVTNTFTQEPLYRAYLRASPQREPVAQYNGWYSRSVSFYFENRAVDLSQAHQANLKRALDFLKPEGRRFLILGAGFGKDCRALLTELRPEVRQHLGKSLYVIDDSHPFSCLVSTERDTAGRSKVESARLTEIPAEARRLNVNFDDKIHLLGYQVNPPRVSPGQSFVVSYYFKCETKLSEDWLVFIHGDGPQGGSHRVFGDHAPVGGLLPTSEWQTGEIIRDDHTMTVPANYPYSNFTLWMGFWKGPERLEVKQAHQHDGANRVRTARMVVE